MRFVYVTRHFNHSGYLILQRLIAENLLPAAIIVQESTDPLLRPIFRPWLILNYRLRCAYYRCPRLKTLASEELMARKASIPILRTTTMKNDAFFRSLAELRPDLILLGGGWHELVPQRVFSLPRLGCVNTHPSLLPEFRGTSITRWQVLHGLSRSGTTITYVDDRFDTGGIIAQKAFAIPPNTTPQELFYHLGAVAADLMPDLLRRFATEGRLPTIEAKHDSRYYNYYRRWQWNAETLRIDPGLSLREMHAFVLANSQESYEYLGASLQLNGRKYFVRQTLLLPRPTTAEWAAGNPTPFGQAFWRGEFLCLARAGEDLTLEIRRIQPAINHRWHRSGTPWRVTGRPATIEITPA